MNAPAKSSTPRRVLLVMPNVASYEAFLGELGAELAARGTEVHLACSVAKFDASYVPRERAGNGPTLHPIEFARGMNPRAHQRAARRLAALVAEVRPDVVHAHFDAAIFTTALARTREWPLTIALFHGLSFPILTGWRKTIIRAATAWAIRQFDGVWVLNSENCALLRAAAPRADTRLIQSAGVGCDIARFTPPSAAERAAVRAELGFGPGHCVFAYVGRLVEAKGFALTVRAFLQAAKDMPDARLLVVGGGDPLHPTGLTPDEEAAMRASAQIVAVGYRTDVERYLGAAEVMVLPSFREGMPVCLMEALALGVPVLTRDVCGCRDVVRDDVDGVVLKDCTAENLAAAMRRLVAEPELRARLSSRALADRDRFSRRHFVLEQCAIYDAGKKALQ
ncbi:MAG: glycosyltransferase [Chthoniobacter sp.]|nr:glycosyltransferase [Chthoniobacter sp.]